MTKVEKVTGDLLTFMGTVKNRFFRPMELVARNRLSPTQFHTLTLLYRRSSLPMSELAGYLKISKQQLTPLVAKMAECGLLERKLDETDRRMVRLEITEAGRDTYRSVFSEMRRKLIDQLGLLPEESLDELENLLGRLNLILFQNSQGGRENG
ncbi:MAG: MarR family transcriptional regulator [Syntrophomonadaceae bacterium]